VHGAAVRLTAVLRRAEQPLADRERTPRRPGCPRIALDRIALVRRPRPGERRGVERAQHRVVVGLRVGAEQPPPPLASNDRWIDDALPAQNVMRDGPRSIGLQPIERDAVLGTDFRRAIHVASVGEGVRIRHVAVADDHRFEPGYRVRRIEPRDAPAFATPMSVLLDEQPVASARIAIRKRIGDESKRRLRREPLDRRQRRQLTNVVQLAIERRDGDVPGVVPRPAWRDPPKCPKLHDVIVVTAASSNHAGPLRYMLASLRALGARVECYDLGLTAPEVRALPRWDGLFYHKFD